MLIGLNNARLAYPRRWVDCYLSGVLAVETDIGWHIYGPDESKKEHVNMVKILMVKSQHQEEPVVKYEELNTIVQDFCKQENLDVRKSLMKRLWSSSNFEGSNKVGKWSL